MWRYIIYLTFFLVVFSCRNNQLYEPKGLIKLTSQELIQRGQNRNYPDVNKIVYRNQQGAIITRDSLEKLDMFEELAFDDYINKEGIVTETVIRKATEADKIIKKKIKNAMEDGPPLKKIDIDCTDDNLSCLLDEVYTRDQKNRDESTEISWEIDFANLEIVASILDKCGMPKSKSVGKKRLGAIWLVLQHSPRKYQKYYMPMLKEAVNVGDLNKQYILMMEDRILMMEGKPQIYGTQVFLNRKTGEHELHKTIEPAYLDYRRAKEGMEPINDYLAHWGARFNVPQKSK